MLDSMLTVIKCFESHADPIMFVTRAVRIIDLITNSVEMKKFRKRGGIEVFIERLALEIDLCKKEQEFELTPRNSEFVSETINPRSTPTFSKTKRQILEITGATNQNPICMPQRAALLKSILNFLKKCIDDNSNSHGENIMVTSLPKSLRHIISNCEYYGSSLYMLSLNLIQSYIQRDPSDLSCVQETGITDVIIQSIVVKDPPISKETVTNLPLTFMNICMNESGMKHFLTYEPFKKFFKIFLRKDYLPALKRNKKSDSHSSSDSTAKAIGRQIDELIRHHPRLKSPVVDAVIDMLNCLVSMSQDDNVTVVKYNQVHSSRDSHAIPSTQDSILDDDESFCRLRPDTPVSSRTSPVTREEPLMEYLVNVLHFIESILSNNNTVDNYREFVTRGGIVDILKLLWMKQKPEDFPRSLGVHQIGKLLNTIFQLSHSDDVTKILFQEMYAFMVRPEYALSKSQQEYKTAFELNEEAPCFLVQCAALEPEKSKLHQQNFLNELMTLQSMLQIFNTLISVTQRPLLLQEIFKYGFVQLFTEELNNIQRNLHWETLMTYFTFIDETSLKFQHNGNSEKLNKILEQGKSYDRLPAHIQTLFTQAFQTTQTITELKSKVSFIMIGDRHVKSRNDNSRFRDTYRNYRPQVYEKQPEKISDTTSLTGNQLIQSCIDLVRFSSPIEPLQDNSVLKLQLSRVKLLHYSNSLVSLLKTLTDSSATPQFYHFHLVNFYMRDGFTALHVAFKESMDILTENSKSFVQKTCKLEGLMQNLRELNKRAVLNYIELYLNFLSVVTESKSVLKSIYPLPPDVFREFAGASLEGLENEDLFVKSQETIKNKPHSIVPSLLLNVYKLTWNTVQDLIKDDYLMNNDGLSFSVLSLLTNVVKGEELLIEKAMEKRTVPKSDSLSSHRFLSSDFNNDRYMRIFENYIQNGSSQTPTLPMDSELRTELMAMLRDDRSSGLIGSFSSRLFEQLTGNHPSAPRTTSQRVVSSIPGSQASDQVLRETLDRMADKVQNLMEMGFDEATSRTALAMSPNIDSAVDKCLSGGVTDAHITETLTQARRVGLEWGERLMRARGELPQEATANTESIETSTPAVAANNPDNTTEVEQTETNVEPTDSFESVAEEEEEEPSEMEVVDTLDESVTNEQLTEEATESMVEDASEQTSMEIDEERKKEAEFQRKFNQGDMLNHGKRQEDLKTQYHEYHYEFLKKLHETVSEDSDIKGLSDSYNLWNFVLFRGFKTFLILILIQLWLVQIPAFRR